MSLTLQDKKYIDTSINTAITKSRIEFKNDMVPFFETIMQENRDYFQKLQKENVGEMDILRIKFGVELKQEVKEDLQLFKKEWKLELKSKNRELRKEIRSDFQEEAGKIRKGVQADFQHYMGAYIELVRDDIRKITEISSSKPDREEVREIAQEEVRLHLYRPE